MPLFSPNQFRGPDFFFNWKADGGTTADPQLQFFENFPGHLAQGFGAFSVNTLSVHAVNIPLSISLNKAIFLASFSGLTNRTPTMSASFGLYSLNGVSLSLENSGSFSQSYGSNLSNSTGVSWNTFALSKTQNLTPGPWYFAVNVSSNSNTYSILINSSINPANAIPGGFLMGRMTASTGAMPASIATSDLDITGSDAIRQPYIIITA